MTSDDDIVSPIELTIARIVTEIERQPPFSEKALRLSYHKNVLIEELRKLRQVLAQS